MRSRYGDMVLQRHAVSVQVEHYELSRIHVIVATATLEYRVDNTVRERGIIESGRSIDVQCEVNGTSTILSIVPKGTRVEKGDLLVELDDAALRDNLAEPEGLVEQAKARGVQSEAELVSAKSSM